MAKNLGRITLQKVFVSGVPYGVPHAEDGTLWKDHAPPTEGCIYILVADDGAVIAAGPDPSWNLLADFTVWEVEGSDWQAVIGKRWTGEAIE